MNTVTEKHCLIYAAATVIWPYHVGCYIVFSVTELTSSLRAYYIFSGPLCMIFYSENSRKKIYPLKISLSMKRCPDNQINALSLTFQELKARFFYCGRLSSAQLLPLQAPKHRPIIGPHPVEQTAFRRDIKDNGYKSVFTNLWLGTSTE